MPDDRVARNLGDEPQRIGDGTELHHYECQRKDDARSAILPEVALVHGPLVQ
jgi:terminase large subunit-like protein